MLLANGVASSRAEDAYVLAKSQYMPAVGTVATQESKKDLTEAAMTIHAQGNEIAGTMTRSQSTTSTREVLSPTKIRFLAKEQSVDDSMTVNGANRKLPAKPDPLIGKPVILELKDGKWSAAFEDGSEADEAQKSALEKIVKNANRDSDFAVYGGAPRKVGDEWKVEPSVTGFCEDDGATGTFTVKFLEVKEIEGVKCAILKSTFDFKGKLPANGAKNEPALGIKGEAITIRSIKDLTTLEEKFTGTMTMEGSIAEGATMKVVGPVKGSEKNTYKRP